MTVNEQTSFPPGARILVRDAEWLVRTCTRTDYNDYKITATGISELVRDENAVFFTALEQPPPMLLRPEETILVPDQTAAFAQSRLFLEATLRRTPLPQSERGLALADGFLLDSMTYQQRPAVLALSGLQPRILLADVVGLGKTLEIGLILAELIRRGRGDRILVVTPQQVLEQFQQEMWTRFAIPFIRLDSLGIERIQRVIPAGRNPFTYYKRIIISVDTLKNPGRYGQHLENMHWDAVVIDESHNLIGERTLRNRLARLLARRTDALLLASATPHNGDAESFAELIRMLDPAAIADHRRYSGKDIEHLYLRRTKTSQEVRTQIGDRWAAREPSLPIHCTATDAEERVFAELTGTWLGEAGPPASRSRDQRLFPYTLLKALLSSHRALQATVSNRLKNVDAAADPAEHAALTRLLGLATAVRDDASAKLAALVTRLQEIGVEPGSPARAVVFSESVQTLKWLHKVLPGRLGLTRPGQVEIMHGGIPDVEQEKIVERFSVADEPVRVLLTTDVASEGVNMHRQCHDLIHYDLPWSLIRIEQRNGRIDRYGQERRPRFAALILTSRIPGAKDDTTVAEKLLRREEAEYRALGTVEGVTRQFTAKREEDRLIRDLLAGKTVEESIDTAAASAPDVLADLLASVGEQHGESEPPRATVPQLFTSTEAFAREALATVCSELDVDDDGQMLAFEPPPDLVHRLSVLPPSYLKRHRVDQRMKVTFDRGLAQRKLDEARRSKTLWPDIAYLSDLHPVIEWLTDQVLLRVARQQAPVLLGDVTEPAFLVQGMYSNRLGQPTIVEWIAVTGLPHRPRVGDMTEALEAAGVRPRMINTGRFGDIGGLQVLVPDAVRAAREHLERQRASYDADVDKPLAQYRERLATWEQLSLDGVAAPLLSRRQEEVRGTVTRLGDLIESMHTHGEPLLRVLGVLDGAA